MKDKAIAAVIFHKVMEEVANNTRPAFLQRYGDDSVHVKFQEQWKLKLKKKKDKLCRVAGNVLVPPAVFETPLPDLDPPPQQPSIPLLRDDGVEEAKSKKFKKEHLHQPWLKQKAFGIQDNGGLVDARQTSQLQPPARSGYIHQQDGEGNNIL